MNTLAGIKLNVDGTLEAIELDNDDDLVQMDAIVRALECDWYDVNDSIPGVMVLINDSAADTEMVNTDLTRITREFGFSGQLHGPGIFLSITPENGQLTSLSAEHLALIVTRWTQRTPYAVLCPVGAR